MSKRCHLLRLEVLLWVTKQLPPREMKVLERVGVAGESHQLLPWQHPAGPASPSAKPAREQPSAPLLEDEGGVRKASRGTFRGPWIWDYLSQRGWVPLARPLTFLGMCLYPQGPQRRLPADPKACASGLPLRCPAQAEPGSPFPSTVGLAASAVWPGRTDPGVLVSSWRGHAPAREGGKGQQPVWGLKVRPTWDTVVTLQDFRGEWWAPSPMLCPRSALE